MLNAEHNMKESMGKHDQCEQGRLKVEQNTVQRKWEGETT